MNYALEKITEFAIGALVPGKLTFNDYKTKRAEKENARLKKVSLLEDRNYEHNGVIPAIDVGTWFSQAGLLAYAYNENSPNALGVAATLMIIRGITSVYQTYERKRLESENKEITGERNQNKKDDLGLYILLEK